MAVGAGMSGSAVTMVARAEDVPPRTASRTTSAKTRVKVGHVATEGDTLYYEVRGKGAPLLMVAGGYGDAGLYARAADLLAAVQFRVTTG